MCLANRAEVVDRVQINGALRQGSASSRNGSAIGWEARRAVSFALRAAEAVLSVQALAMVCAASSSVLVLVQDGAIEVGLAAFVNSLDTGRGGGRRSGSATQGQSAVSEVALLFGLAVSERVGVPQTIGVCKASNAVGVIITAVITTSGQASALGAAVAGGALGISHATPTLSRDVGTSRGGAGSNGIVAKLARPSAASRSNTVLAVVEGTSGCGNHGNYGGNRDDRSHRALGRGVRAARVVARNSGVVARGARPHASVSGCARTARQIVAGRGKRKRSDHRGRCNGLAGASVRDRVPVDWASPSRATHTRDRRPSCFATDATPLALRAAVAVLVGSALAVVRTAHPTLSVEIQGSSVKVLAATLIQSAHTRGSRRKGLRGRQDQLSLLISEIALFFGFAVSLDGIGIP